MKYTSPPKWSFRDMLRSWLFWWFPNMYNFKDLGIVSRKFVSISIKIFAKEEDLKLKSNNFPIKGMNSKWDQTPSQQKKKYNLIINMVLKWLFPLRIVIKQFSAWVLILLSFLLSLMWTLRNNNKATYKEFFGWLGIGFVLFDGLSFWVLDPLYFGRAVTFSILICF